jgi:hypothetical protein
MVPLDIPYIYGVGKLPAVCVAVKSRSSFLLVRFYFISFLNSVHGTEGYEGIHFNKRNYYVFGFLLTAVTLFAFLLTI